MPAPRLASDCPTHVLYPCSHDATSEHTWITGIAHVGGFPDTAITACALTTVS
jgi:hypothetical protein